MNDSTSYKDVVAMANKKKSDKEASLFQRLLSMLFSPGIQNLAAGEDVIGTMEKRKELLSPQQTGGMFDVIYRKRLERENAIRDILNQ